MIRVDSACGPHHDVGLDDLDVLAHRLHEERLVTVFDRAVLVDELTAMAGCVRGIKHLHKQYKPYHYL